MHESNQKQEKTTIKGIGRVNNIEDIVKVCANFCSIQHAFQKSGIEHQVTTVKKGETPSTFPYPPNHQLVANCKMTPSLDHQCHLQNLSFDNVAIFIVKWHKLYISSKPYVSQLTISRNDHRCSKALIHGLFTT
jgi:hypothetical protein